MRPGTPTTVDILMNPGHTITITPTDAHVVVHVGGETVAESDHAGGARRDRAAHSLLPAAATTSRMELFRRTNFETQCPFKGQATYWSLQLGDEIHDGILWSYEHPIPGAAGDRRPGVLLQRSSRSHGRSHRHRSE